MPASDGDGVGGKCSSDGGADEDAEEVDDSGGDGDRGQDRSRPVAGGEGHRHQLTLVAEFGNEDDSAADQKCVHW